MNAQKETHKETEAHLIKISRQIERIQQAPETDEDNAATIDAAEQICEHGVCQVTWKPQRPAA